MSVFIDYLATTLINLVAALSLEQLLPANATTVQIHLLTGLLLSLGSALEGMLSL